MTANRSTPRITVVIPAKNRESQLSECLQSVLNQTQPAHEIIVVDDHSTDNTKALVQSFEKYGVHYELNTRKSGAQGARNHGILAATCEWIAFQDSDDRWHPEKLESQCRLINKNSASGNFVIHSSGTKVTPGLLDKFPLVVSEFDGNCYKKLLLNAGPMFQGMLVSRKALLDIGLLDEDCPSFQEWDTAIRLAKENRFIHLKAPLFEWVCHSSATISKDMRRDIQGHMYVLNKHKNEIINEYGQSGWSQAMTDVFCKAIRYGYFDFASQCYEQISNPSKLLAYMALKIKICPRGTGRLFKISHQLFN